MPPKKRDEALILTFKPKTNGIEEKKELKGRFLYIGDFGQKDERDVKDRQIYQDITKDSFNEKLRDMNVEVDFKVQNVLSGKGQLRVRGKIEDIRDFDPDSISNPRKYMVSANPDHVSGKSELSANQEKPNEINQALLLRSAMQELSDNLSDGDPDSFYNMVSDITNSINADPALQKSAIAELASGDITGTLRGLTWGDDNQ